MTHMTCRLTAKNRDQLQNPTLGNRVWATFFIPISVIFYFLTTLYACVSLWRILVFFSWRSCWRKTRSSVRQLSSYCQTATSPLRCHSTLSVNTPQTFHSTASTINSSEIRLDQEMQWTHGHLCINSTVDWHVTDRANPRGPYVMGSGP